jgi:uncharacterized protein YndB with AHSA1/START domain
VSADIEIEIDRPVDEVWAFVSDLTRRPEWLDEFENVVKETPGCPGRGSVLRYTVRPGISRMGGAGLEPATPCL